mgnify:CR=1 FL=1
MLWKNAMNEGIYHKGGKLYLVYLKEMNSKQLTKRNSIGDILTKIINGIERLLATWGYYLEGIQVTLTNQLIFTQKKYWKNNVKHMLAMRTRN